MVKKESWLNKNRHYLTAILSLIAIFVEYMYTRCEYACPSMKGYIFGIELPYVGFAFMVLVALCAMLKKEGYTLFLLSLGAGGEIFLFGYQVYFREFCVYCLIFGGIVMLQFFMYYKRAKSVILFLVIGFASFLLFFEAFYPSYAQENRNGLLTTFGEGKIVVRLYTDYWCGPCKAIEPKVEPIIKDLVNGGIIKITFIDTPFYRLSPLYVRYFLYSLKGGKKSIDYAFSARQALIEASNRKIDTAEKLEAYLEEKGIKVKKFEVSAIFTEFTKYLREDKIDSTPSCVIIKEGKKDKYVGTKDVVEALKELLKK